MITCDVCKRPGKEISVQTFRLELVYCSGNEETIAKSFPFELCQACTEAAKSSFSLVPGEVIARILLK